MNETRNAVVTGAGSGIGRAVAHKLAADGCRVSCWDIDASTAAETRDQIRAAGGTAESVGCDVSKEEQVVAGFGLVDSEWGGTDALLINAGIEGPLNQVPDIELADFQRVVDVNLVGAFLMAKHGIPSLRRRGGGAVVATASILAHVGYPGWAAYSATKGGVVSFMRNLAVEHADEGIRINCISPAGVNTPLNERGLLSAGMEPEDALHYNAREASPEQVAEVVAFLASPNSALINGSAVVLDRGLLASCPG